MRHIADAERPSLLFAFFQIKGAPTTDSWIVDYIRLLCTSMSFTVEQGAHMVRSLEWGANKVEAAALLLQQMPEDARYWALGADMLPKDWRLALSLANRPAEPPAYVAEEAEQARLARLQQRQESLERARAAAGEGEGPAPGGEEEEGSPRHQATGSSSSRRVTQTGEGEQHHSTGGSGEDDSGGPVLRQGSGASGGAAVSPPGG